MLRSVTTTAEGDEVVQVELAVPCSTCSLLPSAFSVVGSLTGGAFPCGAAGHSCAWRHLLQNLMVIPLAGSSFAVPAA